MNNIYQKLNISKKIEFFKNNLPLPFCRGLIKNNLEKHVKKSKK
jgi:hypothetical protein